MLPISISVVVVYKALNGHGLPLFPFHISCGRNYRAGGALCEATMDEFVHCGCVRSAHFVSKGALVDARNSSWGVCDVSSVLSNQAQGFFLQMTKNHKPRTSASVSWGSRAQGPTVHTPLAAAFPPLSLPLPAHLFSGPPSSLRCSAALITALVHPLPNPRDNERRF